MNIVHQKRIGCYSCVDNLSHGQQWRHLEIEISNYVQGFHTQGVFGGHYDDIYGQNASHRQHAHGNQVCIVDLR